MKHWFDHKALHELNSTEWEALCDGCAKCCLHKLEDEDSGEVYYTDVHCRYLDADQCRCKDYSNRTRLAENCVDLRKSDFSALQWLPETCAYRLRAQGQPLPGWHPLHSGDSSTVHRFGVSVRARVISEERVQPDGYEEHIVHWV